MTLIPLRLGLQQRVLPEYRVSPVRCAGCLLPRRVERLCRRSPPQRKHRYQCKAEHRRPGACQQCSRFSRQGVFLPAAQFRAMAEPMAAGCTDRRSQHALFIHPGSHRVDAQSRTSCDRLGVGRTGDQPDREFSAQCVFTQPGCGDRLFKDRGRAVYRRRERP